jgi:two-component system, NtrC family, nitrogen regulation sensor histidine kinase NtrY
MSSAVSSVDAVADRPPRSRWRVVRRGFARWARRVNLWPKLEIGVAVLAVVVGLASYFVLQSDGAPVRQRGAGSLTWIALANLITLMALALLVTRRLVELWLNRRRGLAGSRLHLRLVSLFAAVAIVPTLLVAIFASLLFEFGLQFWFSDRVRTVLDNADQIARSYMEENRASIERDILKMARGLNQDSAKLTADADQFRTVVSLQANILGITEAVVFDSFGKQYASTYIGQGEATQRIPLDAFEKARDSNGEVVIVPPEPKDPNRVQALVRLDDYYDRYLYVSRQLRPDVIGTVTQTQSALSEYEKLKERRRELQLRFNTVLVGVALLILLASIWAALWFANRLTSPVTRLVKASDRVARGDLTARVAVRGNVDELSALARSFNRMTTQLESQTGALVAANQQLDDRRRFTETVLAGVTAGVLSVSHGGEVLLANRSAHELLGVADGDLVGAALDDKLADLAALQRKADIDPSGRSIGQIEFKRGAVRRILLVQVAVDRQADRAGGYVVTFDDVTEQLANQRQAAWSDVARRIAHEIKNPLTPIQLSAERLRRKYLKEITSDPEVFSACTDTIIRQVGDLRRMVDEFSSFARMPKPVFRVEPLLDIVRQAMFLQEIANPQVQFRFTATADTPTLVCDRRQLEQAVANLVKNALEALLARAEAGTQDFAPAIDLKVERREGLLGVGVADNGVGLPQDARERLTEPYVTTRAKGTGLGLAIVKKIAEDHLGKLVLRDRLEADGGPGAVAELWFDPVALLSKLADSGEVTVPEQEGRVAHGA